MSTVERAIAIAAEAHAGQTDKAGAPYILHPLRIMLQMKTDDERIVAVLHDVCEDCPGWDTARLRQEGFSEEIIEALDRVTKREGEEYEAFALRAAGHPVSKAVKLADLRDNSDLSRIPAPTLRDIERVKKYSNAIALIEQT
jgi:(p)ppGpp synthase/HD superfamily hydrolase